MLDLLPRRLWAPLSALLWVLVYTLLGVTEAHELGQTLNSGIFGIGFYLGLIVVALPALFISLLYPKQPIYGVALLQALWLGGATVFFLVNALNRGNEIRWWYALLLLPALMPLGARPPEAPRD